MVLCAATVDCVQRVCTFFFGGIFPQMFILSLSLTFLYHFSVCLTRSVSLCVLVYLFAFTVLFYLVSYLLRFSLFVSFKMSYAVIAMFDGKRINPLMFTHLLMDRHDHRI